jgi:hypothetical protein
MAMQGANRHHDNQRRITALEKTVTDLARRQNNLMEERENKTIDEGDELGRVWAERLRTRFADLETKRRTKEAELEELRSIAESEQPQQPELLDLTESRPARSEVKPRASEATRYRVRHP